MVKKSAAGLVAASLPCGITWMNPAQARARGAKPLSFTASESALFAQFSDAIVPGAAELGVAEFVDHHLSVIPADSLLMLRYLDIAPPYIEFYRNGLQALATLLGQRLETSGPLTKQAHWEKLVSDFASERITS